MFKTFPSIFIGITAYALTCVNVVCAIPGPPSSQPHVEGMETWVYEVVSTASGKPEGGLGDDISVRVANLDSWLNNLNNRSNPVNKNRTWATSDLVLIINGIVLPGTHPQSIQTEPPQDADKYRISRLTTLQFRLSNDSRTQEAWNSLLNHPQFRKEVSVTVGVESADVEPVTTSVHKNPDPGYASFTLIVIRTGLPLAFGIIVIVASLLIFFWLANRTTLLSDTTSDRRPDGKWPLSLARTQMAFWFFLVMGSFLLLWIVTGAQDTITTSVLTLIGISAGTALGAAVVDSGKGNGGPGYAPLVRAETLVDTKTPAEFLRHQLAAWEAALRTSQAALSAALTTNATVAVVDAATRQVTADQNAVSRTRTALEFSLRKPWMRVMYDLLGDNGSIGFHRFQIAVWTLVLGIIFVTQVYSQLSMPTFSSTLLGLMGISAGTYIGFKIPEGPRQG